ncbi:MAG: PAS domain S-box protein [Mariprofundaceae bacterium]
MSSDENASGHSKRALNILEGGFADILHSIPDAVVSINEDQKIIFFNSGAEGVFGYRSEEILGKPIDLLVPKHLHLSHRRQVRDFVEAAEPPRYKHARGGIFGVRKGGELFPAEASISTVEVNGQPVVTAVVRDVSKQKEDEATLRTHSVAMDRAGEAILITDRDGVIEYVNQAFTNITGYSAEEVIGKNPSLLKSSAQDPAFYKELWETITAGDIWSGTLIDRRKDGSFYPSKLSISPILNEEGYITHYVSVQMDMTEHKKLEDQFLHAQKMESIGTLVGGIAHDFNNMLTGILGNAYLTKKSLDNSAEIVERMDDIEKLGFHSADMIRQLLTFARKEVVETVPVAIVPFVKEAIKLAKTGVPESVTLHSDICSDELYVRANTTQLQQIMMNLVTNAYHAVEGVKKPKITVSLDRVTCTEEHQDLLEKQCIKLSVRDNGQGIAAEHMDKIFEPFFTTKEVTSGTGLGLAMVYGAVKSHDGHVEAESAGLGQGATFSIYLPLTEMNLFQEDREAENPLDGLGRSVLLVDDGEEVLETNRELLENFNFRVLTATNGEEAIEAFKVNLNQIDLVITDVVMPIMSGIEAAKEIRKLDRHIPILFLTGYDESYAMGRETLPEHSMLITKPFSMKRLGQGIHSLLE